MRCRIDFATFEEFVIYALERIMTQLSDVTNALATLAADVTAETAAVQAEIAAIQAANPTVDLSGVLTSIQNIDAAVKAATPAPAPTSPP